LRGLTDALRGRDRAELRDACGRCERAGLEMHLEAAIEQLTDAHRSRDQVGLEMHFKAEI